MASFKVGFFNLIIFLLLQINKTHTVLANNNDKKQAVPNPGAPKVRNVADHVTLKAQHRPVNLSPGAFDEPVQGCCGKLVSCWSDTFAPNYARKLAFDVPSSRFGFHKPQRSALNHPNKLKAVKFNGLLLLFDEKTKMPTYRVIYVTVYTTPNSVPLLVEFKGLTQFNYYGYDKKTGLWTNKELKDLNGSKCPVECVRKLFRKGFDEVDENGLRYYSVDKPESTKKWNETLYKKWENLNKRYDNVLTFKVDSGAPSLEFDLEWYKLEPLPKGEFDFEPKPEPVPEPEPLADGNAEADQ